jgi:DNA-binding Lrp family transcriptional regulator
MPTPLSATTRADATAGVGRATVMVQPAGGQRGMLSAYVLIQTEVGKAGQVAQAIGGIDGVQRAEDVAGPYDVIARVQAPGMDELGRLVVARIQAVDGVTRTLTCTMIRR